MITSFKFVNLNKVSLDLNTDMIPLQEVYFENDVRSSHRNKAQAHGSWPGYTYFGATLVHCTGEVFGTDSNDFNIRKFNIVNTILPNPLTFRTDYPLGHLEIQLDSMTEAAKADCTIDGDISLAMIGDSPARSALQITWVVFSGYFIGVATGKTYWLK